MSVLLLVLHKYGLKHSSYTGAIFNVRLLCCFLLSVNSSTGLPVQVSTDYYGKMVNLNSLAQVYLQRTIKIRCYLVSSLKRITSLRLTRIFSTGFGIYIYFWPEYNFGIYEVCNIY
jgi:hypothetical protein